MNRLCSRTYQCPIRCRYCGVNGGPYHTGRMPDFIRRMIDQAKALTIVQLVVFTGGEPFLLGEDLYTSSSLLTWVFTRVVTNAYWATSFVCVCEVIERLKRLGLTELNYSCDDFHQEFIPRSGSAGPTTPLHVGVPVLIAAKGLKRSTITPATWNSSLVAPLPPFAQVRPILPTTS